MGEKIKFAVEDIEKYIDDVNPELAIAKIKFLSTRPNSHQINITDDILKRDASTILGKFLIGKMNILGTDTEGHTPDEQIFGYFPTEQNIDFEEEDDGYLSASANAVISKLYANNYYNMFVNDNKRKVSVEMTTYGLTKYPNGSADIEGMNLTGCTTLGHNVEPSCPDAQMSIVQFSEKKANEFYNNTMKNSNELKKFAERRKQDLAENYESHPVDTSKDAVDMGDWNGNKAKKDLLKEKNFDSVGKKVCLDFKGGDRILENCKYPVMNLKDGKWVYNAEGLSSARAYGAQHDEAIANKAIAIQKKLGLYEDDKKEEGGAKMSQEKFAVDITNLYSLIYDILEDKYPDKDWGSIYRIEGIYEEANQKFAVIVKNNDPQLYRLDFEIDENNNLILSDKIVNVEQTFTETNGVQKFEAPKDAEKFKMFEVIDDKKDNKKDDEKDTKQTNTENKMSLNANLDSATLCDMLEEQEKKYQEIADELEDKNNIIMEQEEELSDLRQFKSDCLEKEKMATVSETLSKVKDKMTDEEYAKFEKEGTECKFEDIQAWKNNVLINLVDSVLFSDENDSHKENNSHMRMNIFHDDKDNDKKSLWEKL